jgi:hypothetical protein
MKKNTVKRLNLNRETLLSLRDFDLRLAPGALPTGPYCGPTYRNLCTPAC